MRDYAAVVLAAGRAARYRAAGGSEPTKLLATLEDEPLVRYVVAAALGSRARPVLLVTGHAGEAVAEAVADLPVTRVHNAAYANGLAGTLRTGVDALPPSCPGAVVLLADMPTVGSDTIDALIAQAADRPDADAVVPSYEGRRGNPVLLARTLFPAVARLTGDVGARHLLRDSTLRIIDLPVRDPGILNDVDLPEQLRRLRGGAAGRPPFTLY